MLVVFFKQLSTVPSITATMPHSPLPLPSQLPFTAATVFTGALHRCLVQSHHMHCFHHCLICI